MAVAIRPAAPGDRAAWGALYQGYQRFYRRDPDQAFYDTAFARLMARDPRDFHGLVAEDDGRLLGLAHFVFHPSLWRPEGACYLQDLFTAEEVRGRGVGRALIAAVYAAADAAGVPWVYWLTAETNLPARALYDKVAEGSNLIRYNRPV